MRFTSFNLHKPTHPTGKCGFYFGQRYEENGKIFTPLSIFCDHSNADPDIISRLMDRFVGR